MPARLFHAGAITALVILAGRAAVATAQPLPDPLGVEDVAHLAATGRAEVAAARAQAEASARRPRIASSLEDPMVTASVDHLPFMLDGVNASFMVEQSFPLSHLRRNRGRVAEAEARRTRAEVARVKLDVELDAVDAFLMLYRARRGQEITRGQAELATSLAAAASARYAAGQGSQAEVLRAETEVARLAAEAQAGAADASGAEAMLRASLGRPPGETIPRLLVAVDLDPPEGLATALGRAKTARPELVGMRAEVERARAEVDVMRSMYGPMASIGLGSAYTMTDGPGLMAVVSLSIPLWRGRLGAGVSEAEAMVAMQRSELLAMERMVEGQVGAARAAVEASLTRVRTLRGDVLPRARQAVDAAMSAYGAAQVPLVTVLDAAQALWGAEEDLVQAEVNLELDRARLRRAALDEAGGKAGSR